MLCILTAKNSDFQIAGDRIDCGVFLLLSLNIFLDPYITIWDQKYMLCVINSAFLYTWKRNCDVNYFLYTSGISSSFLNT